MGWYRQGTVSIEIGATAVTGALTAWTNQAKAEDRITFDGGGKWYEIASVESNTGLTLVGPFAEATLSGAAYAIDRSGREWGLVSGLAARVSDLLALFPPLTGIADAGKWFKANAAGTAFETTSAAPATIEIGTVTTGAPGTDAVVTNSGTEGAAVFDITIPRGADGVDGTDGEDAVGGGGRELLTAARTYYVRTDGSDSNDGLANTSGGAFLTLQKAIDTAAGLDLGVYNVTIQVGNGTYTGANTLKKLVGVGTVTILGDATTPSNVVISTTSADAFYGNGPLGNWVLRGVKIQTTTSGNAIRMDNGAALTFNSLDFGTCAGAHMLALGQSNITISGNYAISGGATRHYYATQLSVIQMSGNYTITITGTMAFSTFALIDRMSFGQLSGITFSGTHTVTGQRYSVAMNSVCYTNGAQAAPSTNYFRGNSDGATATGGLIT